jgi:O-antigen ligase
MLNLILPLSVALLVSSRNFASRALLAATIVLSILAVLLTFSRGGFLTLAATALTGLVRRMKGIAAIGAGAALLTALLCLPYVSSVYVDHLRGAEWRMVHNVYLECGADLGLPGLLLFTLLLVASIRSARRAAGAAAATPGMEKISVFAEGIATSLIGFAVAAMFHPVSYHFYFYYIAALAVAVHGISAARIREGSGA